MWAPSRGGTESVDSRDVEAQEGVLAVHRTQVRLRLT